MIAALPGLFSFFFLIVWVSVMSVFSFLKNDIPVEGATVTYLTKRKRDQSLHLMVTAYNGQALDIGESSVCLGTLCIFHIMASLQRIIYRRLLEQARKAMFSVLRKIKVKKNCLWKQ